MNYRNTAPALCLASFLPILSLGLPACGSDSDAAPLNNGAGDGDASGSGGAGDGHSEGSGGTTGGGTETGGTPNDGSPGTGAASTGGSGDPGSDLSACDDADLVWKTGHKTNYTSYPEPGSVECVEYNGCMWEGLFAGCNGKQTEEWVAATNIVAFFPGFDQYRGHELCIRSGDKKMIVHVLDTCGDSDCDGCCTRNKGDKDALIDLESYTNERWGLPDGAVEWADLGPAASPCN